MDDSNTNEPHKLMRILASAADCMVDLFLLFEGNFLTNVIFLYYMEQLWHMRHNDRNVVLKSILCDDSSFSTMKNTIHQPFKTPTKTVEQYMNAGNQAA